MPNLEDVYLGKMEENNRLSLETLYGGPLDREVPIEARNNDIAHSALFSEDPVMAYDVMKKEWYKFGDRSPTQEAIYEQLGLKEKQEKIEAYRDLILDKEIDPNVQRLLVEDLRATQENEGSVDIEERVAMETAASEATDESNSPGKRAQGDWLLDSVDKWKQLREVKQRALNLAASRAAGQKWWSTAKDMAMYLFPLLDKKATSNLGDIVDPDTWDVASYAFEGVAIDLMKKNFQAMPFDEQMSTLNGILDALYAGGVLDDLVLTSSQLKQLEILTKVLNDEDYTKSEWALDNLFSMIDVSVVGGFLARMARMTGLPKTFTAIRKANKEFNKAVDDAEVAKVTGTSTQPASVANSLTHEQVTDLYVRALVDESGILAKNGFGMTLEELRVYGKVPTPVKGAEEYFFTTSINVERDAARLRERIYGEEALQGTKEELEAIPELMKDRLSGMEGYTYKTESSTIEFVNGAEVSDRVAVKAMYSSSDDAPFIADTIEEVAEAKRRLQKSLAQYGVSDKDIQALKKLDDGTYVPMKEGDVGEFLLTANFNYKATPNDFISALLDPKWNFFDRVPGLGGGAHTKYTGTFTNNVFDAASVFPKYVHFGAIHAVNQANEARRLLQNIFATSSKMMKSLNKNEQAFLLDYMKQSNYNRTPYDYAQLRLGGVSQEGIDMLKVFSRGTDLVYDMDNLSVVRNLKAEGYWRYSDHLGSQMFVKRFEEGAFRADKNYRVYDPLENKVITMSKAEVEELYAKGESLGRVRDPVNISEDIALGGDNGVLVKLATNDSRVDYRALTESDKVLNRIEGYFKIQYDAPHFIFKKNKDGDEVVIGMASSKKEAEAFLKNFREKEPGTEFGYRADKTGKERKSTETSLDMTSGLAAQRVRGKQLQSLDSGKHVDWSNPHIEHPINAMLNASVTTAEKLMMRDWLETMKQRFVNEYGHLLRRDTFDHPIWPEHAGDFLEGGNMASREIANARTTYNYITAMEHGYVDFLDDRWKAGMNAIADLLGNVTARGERGARAVGKVSPNSAARKTAATKYLFLNPQRQIIIQGHQAIQLTARYGKNAPLAVNDALALSLHRAGLSKLKEGTYLYELSKGLDNSGLIAAVSEHSFLKNTALHNVDMSLARVRDSDAGVLSQAVGSGIRGGQHIVSLGRKVGFDAGEYMNRTTAYAAAYRRKYNEVGRPLTKREQAEVAAEAEDFTYTMNRAGDMPYNATSISAIAQFMQIPHKALLQMTTSRALTGSEKTRMAIWNMTMYGVPGSTILYGLSKDAREALVDHPNLAQGLQWGLEELMFNKFLSVMSGQEVNLHFTNLSPLDNAALMDFMSVIVNEGWGSAWKASPGGSIFFNNGASPFNKFVDNLIAWANPEYEGLLSPSFQNVINSGAELASSGYSNYIRAKLAIEHDKLVSAVQHNTIQEGLPTAAKIGIFFGFTTQQAHGFMMTRDYVYSKTKRFEQDIDALYAETKNILAAYNGDPRDIVEDVYNVLGPQQKAIMEENPAGFWEYWFALCAKDARKGNHSALNLLIGAYTKMMPEDFANAMGALSQEEKEKINAIIREMEGIKAVEQKIEDKKNGK